MEETHCWLVAVADEKAKVVRSEKLAERVMAHGVDHGRGGIPRDSSRYHSVGRHLSRGGQAPSDRGTRFRGLPFLRDGRLIYPAPRAPH